MMSKYDFTETPKGFKTAKNWITLTVTYDTEEGWILTVKAFGFITFEIPIQELLELLKRKKDLN